MKFKCNVSLQHLGSLTDYRMITGVEIRIALCIHINTFIILFFFLIVNFFVLVPIEK